MTLDVLESEIGTLIHGQAELTEFVAILRQARDRGVTQAEAVAVLSALRAKNWPEPKEDLLLEVLDCATGWCAPHMRVWDRVP